MPFWSRRRQLYVYRVGATYRDKRTFPVCRVTNIEDMNFRLDTGQPISAPIPEVLEYEVDLDLPLADFVLTAGPWVLVSRALWSLMKDASSCVRAYPSRIVHRSEVRSEEYVTVHFDCSFECLDWKRSRFSQGPYRPGQHNGLLQKIMILESKLPEGESLFRLGESPPNLFATESFKEAVSDRALTGIEFERFRVATG